MQEVVDKLDRIEVKINVLRNSELANTGLLARFLQEYRVEIESLKTEIRLNRKEIQDLKCKLK